MQDITEPTTVSLDPPTLRLDLISSWIGGCANSAARYHRIGQGATAAVLESTGADLVRLRSKLLADGVILALKRGGHLRD